MRAGHSTGFQKVSGRVTLGRTSAGQTLAKSIKLVSDSNVRVTSGEPEREVLFLELIFDGPNTGRCSLAQAAPRPLEAGRAAKVVSQVAASGWLAGRLTLVVVVANFCARLCVSLPSCVANFSIASRVNHLQAGALGRRGESRRA